MLRIAGGLNDFSGTPMFADKTLWSKITSEKIVDKIVNCFNTQSPKFLGDFDYASPVKKSAIISAVIFYYYYFMTTESCVYIVM
jgi:hypothetical protein